MAYIGLKQLDPVLTGSLQVSGSVGFTGSLSLRAGDKIFTEADEGTYLQSDSADRLRAVVGGSQMLLMDQDEGRVNVGYGQKLGVGLGNNTTPGVELEVAGDVSGSGLGSFGTVYAGTHITASGNISASGTIIAEQLTTSDDLLVGDQARIKTALVNPDAVSSGDFRVKSENLNHVLYTDANKDKVGIGWNNPAGSELLSSLHIDGDATLTHITASGNISASGDIFVDDIIADDHIEARRFSSTGDTQFGNSTDDLHTFTGHITASGNISASGYIYGDGSNLTGITSGIFQPTGSVQATTNNLQITGSITASGGISANTFSGDGSNITGVTAEWDGTHTGTATFTGNVTASGVVSASGGFVGDGSNITGVTADWDGTHVGDAQITGSLNVSSSFSISNIEVDTSGSVRDEVLKFNGTKWVSAAEGSTFVFSIASFSDGESTSQIAGTAGATWKSADAITFTATYNNGPPTTAAISESTTSTGVSDWTTPFATDDNTVAITYPSPGSTRRFQVIADGLTTNESSITFKNYIYYGASTQADSYNESFIEGLTSTLSEDKTQNNLSINASGNKYIFWTYPNRLGTVSNYFTWGTGTGNQVVIETSVIGSAYSVTNSAGLTENYKIYRSDITVNESGRLDTGVSLINYIYWGSTGHDSIPGASGWDSDDIKNLEFKDNSNDQTQVWTEITSMTSDYILLCIPSRITDPASFWDNSTGFGADFESSVTVSVINQYGYTENYDVFRSTNTVTGDFTLETK